MTRLSAQDSQDGDESPCLTLTDETDSLARVLRAATRLLLEHPAVMQATFAALVAEGRAFARSPEGERWERALAGSELVRHGRAIWESSALNLLEDSPGAVLPSAVIDAFVHAASSPDLQEKLPGALHG